MKIKLYLLAGLILICFFITNGFLAAKSSGPPVVKTPIIHSITPGSVITGKTLNVTIKGSGFREGNPVVRFYNISAGFNAVCNVVSDSQLTVTIPGKTAAGKYAVTVTNKKGTSKPVFFTVGTAVKLTSVNPRAGNAGWIVILRGRYIDLGGKPTVTFGGYPGKVISYSATKLYVTVPDKPKGKVKVTVNNSFGESNSIFFQVMKK